MPVQERRALGRPAAVRPELLEPAQALPDPNQMDRATVSAAAYRMHPGRRTSLPEASCKLCCGRRGFLRLRPEAVTTEIEIAKRRFVRFSGRDQVAAQRVVAASLSVVRPTRVRPAAARRTDAAAEQRASALRDGLAAPELRQAAYQRPVAVSAVAERHLRAHQERRDLHLLAPQQGAAVHQTARPVAARRVAVDRSRDLAARSPALASVSLAGAAAGRNPGRQIHPLPPEPALLGAEPLALPDALPELQLLPRRESSELPR